MIEEWIDALFKRVDTKPPRPVAGYPVEGIESDGGDVELAPSGICDDDAVDGVTVMIEYTNSSGVFSRRRITMRGFQSASTLYAYCHERLMLRCFRLDRIAAVIDGAGEVHVPVHFFAALGVTIPEGKTKRAAKVDRPRAEKAPAAPRPERQARAAEPAPRPAKAEPAAPPVERPGMAQRRAARDGLRVLCALSRSDGRMHPEEVDVILDYIADKADQQGIVTTEADRAALAPYVRNQYPAQAVLLECLRNLGKTPEAEQRRFLSFALKLIDADGEQHPAEFDMLMRMKEWVG